ncbi:MAG: beta-galactosidase, partial [Bdellovibrionales bacterium]
MITNQQFGASFSLHRCSELGLNKKRLLKATLKDLGFKRLRLMSYWNIHEQKPEKYDFKELDWQMNMAEKYGAKVTLCLGKRQPRWPECHMPEWAKELPKSEWYQALFDFITVVVKRYKDHPALESWQLENEALLKEFGDCHDRDFSHKRLQKELELVKNLDDKHPVIMSLSDSWGFPFKKPIPDIYAMSLYRITLNKKSKYSTSSRPSRFYKLRSLVIGAVRNKPVFIHELQAEPWLPNSILESSIEEQLEYMNPEILTANIN